MSYLALYLSLLLCFQVVFLILMNKSRRFNILDILHCMHPDQLTSHLEQQLSPPKQMQFRNSLKKRIHGYKNRTCVGKTSTCGPVTSKSGGVLLNLLKPYIR